jgi:hypothetical protein
MVIHSAVGNTVTIVSDAALINLNSLPMWTLLTVALVGLAVFVGVLFWMMPARLRRTGPGASVWLAAGLFILLTALTPNPRQNLWFGGVLLAVAALPLRWMGKLPEDMPSARDPSARLHPKYRQVARRGRIAGFAIVVLEVVAITLSVMLVGAG